MKQQLKNLICLSVVIFLSACGSGATDQQTDKDGVSQSAIKSKQDQIDRSFDIINGTAANKSSDILQINCDSMKNLPFEIVPCVNNGSIKYTYVLESLNCDNFNERYITGLSYSIEFQNCNDTVIGEGAKDGETVLLNGKVLVKLSAPTVEPSFTQELSSEGVTIQDSLFDDAITMKFLNMSQTFDDASDTLNCSGKGEASGYTCNASKDCSKCTLD